MINGFRRDYSVSVIASTAIPLLPGFPPMPKTLNEEMAGCSYEIDTDNSDPGLQPGKTFEHA
jgi:hypothetical protein